MDTAPNNDITKTYFLIECNFLIIQGDTVSNKIHKKRTKYIGRPHAVRWPRVENHDTNFNIIVGTYASTQT